jgi:cyclic pyranopterin phosphate synthase
MSQLCDPFGRMISYLRVSVTDRCNYRCTYCMAEDMTFLPKKDLLSLEELDRLCRIFVSLGVDKIRITGGEPLVRRDVMKLFHSLGKCVQNGELDELTLTTNGSQLAKFSDQLIDCGVRRVNVSLDSLIPEKFKRITRWGDLSDVMAGIQAAKRAGLKIKINTVGLAGINDNEIEDLVSWSAGEGFDLTFIETMPVGEINEDRSDRYLPTPVIRERIGQRWTMEETNFKTGGPANYVTIKETGQRIGFITPLSHNFCEGCNRVRLTCTGVLYMCLGQDDAADLRTVLRQSEGNSLVVEAIERAIGRKPKGHDFDISRAASVSRHMNVTGG